MTTLVWLGQMAIMSIVMGFGIRVGSDIYDKARSIKTDNNDTSDEEDLIVKKQKIKEILSRDTKNAMTGHLADEAIAMQKILSGK